MASANGTLPSIAKAAFNCRALAALVDRAICHINITSCDASQAQGTSSATPSLPSQIRNYLLCKGSALAGACQSRLLLAGLPIGCPCEICWRDLHTVCR